MHSHPPLCYSCGERLPLIIRTTLNITNKFRNQPLSRSKSWEGADRPGALRCREYHGRGVFETAAGKNDRPAARAVVEAQQCAMWWMSSTRWRGGEGRAWGSSIDRPQRGDHLHESLFITNRLPRFRRRIPYGNTGTPNHMHAHLFLKVRDWNQT